MKTAGRENPNRPARLCHEPSPWGGRPKPFLLNQGGWRARKRPAEGRVFFLTSPFIELLGRNPNTRAKCQVRRKSGCTRQRRDNLVVRHHKPLLTVIPCSALFIPLFHSSDWMRHLHAVVTPLL